MANQKERRQRTRVPLSGLAVVTVGNNMLIASAMNIAAGGISVVVPEPVKEGTRVSVEFGLPGAEDRFLIKAIVARVEKKPDGFQLGMRFDSYEGKVLVHVQEFVREQLLKLVKSRQAGASGQPKPAQSQPPSPSQPTRPPVKGEEYKPTSMTIDLDGSERAGEVARLFHEAWKKTKE